jgi:hypothetical protein
MEIEVFGATGEFSSGKTIIGLSIAPGVHPEGHEFAGKPRTLYLDFEKSGTTYAGTGCERYDVPARIAEKLGTNYTTRQVAEWFVSIPSQLKPGQFDVIMADPINDVESGIIDLVKSKATDHGYTSNQFDKSTPLLMAAVKAYWKKVLLLYANVCKCFFFTTHLRDQFRGSTPTGKREPRGKETLAELASLYLWMERKPDDKGNTPEKPSAIVLKQRLADTDMNADGELVITNLMPPRIPEATVKAIRGYIANPPNYAKLAEAERVIEVPMTEAEMERLKANTAEMRANAALAEFQVLDRQQQLMAMRRDAQATTQTAAKPSPAPIATEATPTPEPATTPEPAKPIAEQEALQKRIEEQNAQTKRLMEDNQPLTTFNDRIERFVALTKSSQVSPERTKTAITLRGKERFSQLAINDQDEILAWLQDLSDCYSLIAKLNLGEDKIKSLATRAGVNSISELSGDLAKQLKEKLAQAAGVAPF